MKGIVLRTFGAGNAPDNNPDFLAALREAHDMGIVIVNTTQCIRAYHTPSMECHASSLSLSPSRRLLDPAPPLVARTTVAYVRCHRATHHNP